MKKVLAMLLAAFMVVSLASCGGSDDSSSSSESQSEAASDTEKEESRTSSKTPRIPKLDDAVTEEPAETEEPTEKETEAPVEKTEALDYVDVDALSNIENNDPFKVKITKKEIQTDAATGFSLSGNDLIVLNLTNNDTKDISKVSIYLLAYDENKVAHVINTGTYSVSLGNSEKYIKGFVTGDDLVIKPGQTEEVAIRTTADDIAGIRCIVSSYTMDGKEIENDLVTDWYKHAYVGKNKELD